MSRDRDLVSRTTIYASKVVRFFVSLPRKREEVAILGRQFLRSGTSVAANYREAARARSTAEYVSKLGSCLQEVDESSLWLELLQKDCAISGEDLDFLSKETNELTAIFASLIHKNK